MATKQTATASIKLWDFTLTMSGGIIGVWSEWTYTLTYGSGQSKTYHDEHGYYTTDELSEALWVEAVRIVEKYGRNISVEVADVEVCPDCDERITDDNPLVDETRYSTQFGSCIGCCDPTP